MGCILDGRPEKSRSLRAEKIDCRFSHRMTLFGVRSLNGINVVAVKPRGLKSWRIFDPKEDKQIPRRARTTFLDAPTAGP